MTVMAIIEEIRAKAVSRFGSRDSLPATTPDSKPPNPNTRRRTASVQRGCATCCVSSTAGLIWKIPNATSPTSGRSFATVKTFTAHVACRTPTAFTNVTSTTASVITVALPDDVAIHGTRTAR